MQGPGVEFLHGKGGRRLTSEGPNSRKLLKVPSTGELKLAVFLVNFVNAACTYPAGRTVAVSNACAGSSWELSCIQINLSLLS